MEIWDLSPFLRFSTEPNPWGAGRPEYRLWKSWREVARPLSALKDETLIVCMVGYYYASYPIYKAISLGHARYCMSFAHALPEPPGTKQARRALLSHLSCFKISRLFDMLLKRIPPNWLGLKTASLALVGGIQTVERKYPLGKKTEFVWAHPYDYDTYLEEIVKPVQAQNTLAVFLDEYTPFHPDYAYHQLMPPCTPGKYYPVLETFFEELERTHGVRVAIAAHPRSRYDLHPECFPGRTIVKGETVQQVRRSRFVIAQSSTSIFFAVLFRKPVVFIITDELEKSFLQPYIEFMASLLGKRVVNISHAYSLDFDAAMAVDEQAYANFQHRYIKREGSEDIPSWQILADRLKKFDSATPAPL